MPEIQFTIRTTKQMQFVDITQQIRQIVHNSKVKEGLCNIFIPHTTAAVTINENADPDVVDDMLMELNKIIPLSDNYKHREGNSAAHIKSTLVGASETIHINEGRIKLGTWQGIYFCEFDGPRSRQVWVKIITSGNS